jgi:dihydrofolate synthase/folylpolyglutamate synthase
METCAESSAALAAALTRLEALIDWESRDRAPGERGQAMRVDLEPVTDLLSLLGRPDMTLTCVHVAGSKGKGSVSSLVAAGLKAAGLRVGRFASPHVERLTERVLIDGAEVDDDLLAAALGAALDAREVAIKDASPAKDSTWFDALTAAALLLFREADLGYAVIECGLGGRLDSTNVIVGDVCVVTNIELEHTNVLGTTHAEIAFEKVSILGQSAGFVTGVPSAPDGAGDVIDKHVDMMGTQALRPAWAMGHAPLPHSIEQRNRDLAGLVLDELGRRDWGMAEGASAGRKAARKINAGLLTEDVCSQARLPGRMELFEHPVCHVALDGAHVASSLELVLDDLQSRTGLSGPPIVILALGADKDQEAILKVLAPRADRLLCTSVGHRPAALPGELVENAKRIEVLAEMANTPQIALSRALELAEEQNATGSSSATWILITGSLHLIGELRPTLRRTALPIPLPSTPPPSQC